MRTIRVDINNAKIENFVVGLGNDKPEVTATVGLYAGIRKITTFTIATTSWNDLKFQLPPDMVPPILAIADELEKILVQKATELLALLEPPKDPEAVR